MSDRWQVILEVDDPPMGGVERKLALEVDPRARTVRLGLRVPGTGALEIQSGAVARSFFSVAEGNLSEVGEFLESEDAASLLLAVEAGFASEVLWTGDPVVHWSESAWEAGHALYVRVAEILEARGADTAER